MISQGNGNKARISNAGWNVRVLIDELGAVVDLAVDHQEQVLLGVVLGNILVSELLRHFDGGAESDSRSKMIVEYGSTWRDNRRSRLW
jgi:hypothetical protein